MQTNPTASVVGQILSYLIRVTTNISFGVNQLIVCDGLMYAFLRCLKYCDLSPEDELIRPGEGEEEKIQIKQSILSIQNTKNDRRNSINWASKGEVLFNGHPIEISRKQ